MRLKVIVYLRPKAVAALIAKKAITSAEIGKKWSSQKWLATKIGVSESAMSTMMAGIAQVPPARQRLIIDAFRGMTIKRGHRVEYEDLFQQTFVETTNTSV